MNILIVRLGALGDIVHTMPAAAALRAAMPEARIDWLVEARHRDIVDLVTAVDGVLPLEGRTLRAWTTVARRLRLAAYDVALDFQGLMKSAVLARASGARRVAGFSIWHLREKTARPFYSDTDDSQPGHVIMKNLSLLRVIGIESDRIEFPLAQTDAAAVATVRRAVGSGDIALINPGAAWPNKRWPAARFGEVAAFLREIRGITSVVLWGPGEQELAREIVAASSGSAIVAPPTRVPDLVALARESVLMLSGDTGPLHLAGAAGTPIVAIMGPTNPQRNGPWAPDDVTVSRFEQCGCHYDRRCRERAWCLDSVTVSEVTAAIQRRLGTRIGSGGRGSGGGHGTRMDADGRGSGAGPGTRIGADGRGSTLDHGTRIDAEGRGSGAGHGTRMDADRRGSTLDRGTRIDADGRGSTLDHETRIDADPRGSIGTGEPDANDS